MAKKYNILNEIPNVLTGCKLHDDCLTCPFPDCIDGTGGAQKVIIQKRKQETIKLFSEGLEVEQIAKKLNIYERTIRRYLGAKC